VRCRLATRIAVDGILLQTVGTTQRGPSQT
jgi:hypothetical protein